MNFHYAVSMPRNSSEFSVWDLREVSRLEHWPLSF